MASGFKEALFPRIRMALSDEDEPYRWTDDDLTLWANEGRQALWQFRPDAFYVTKVVTTPPRDIEYTAALDVLPTYQAYLVNYVVARCLGNDAEHAANLSKAVYYQQMLARNRQ